MSKKGNVSESFVQEFVVGFGLLEGIWIHIGTNPEQEIINALSFFSSTGNLKILYSLFSLIAFLLTFYVAFKIGGYLGLIAVILAFISGIFLDAPNVIAWTLLVALGLGWYAPILKI